ncbi:M4 family metallopeptidase [Streptomyces sp. NPDC006925]|uniref:M4 family metallopeptidase n=1 Tax=Streptomyces sp. NPDC006925 TaxID=3364768 RepID=UPI00368258CB
MNRPTLRAPLALALGGLLIAGALSPATAAGRDRPTPPKPSRTEALRDAEEQAAEHPAAVRAGDHDTFRSRSVLLDKDGSRHVHLDRSYRGLPVIGGDVVVHSAPDGGLRDTDLTLKHKLSLPTKARVTARQAESKAESLFKGTRSETESALVIDAVSTATPRLAWQVKVHGTAKDQSPSHLNVLVDAKKGSAGLTWDDFHTASGSGHGYQTGDVSLSTTAVSGGYQLKDPSRGNGETRDAMNQRVPGDGDIPAGWGSALTDSDNVWGNGSLSDRATVAVDAHYGIQATWDYFKNEHNRNGIADDGVGARSFVHYGENYGNAGWDTEGFAMYYGDGDAGQKPFTQIDIAGHEMSHGVTQSTADLIYAGESGGLNEATSDIFGTLVEFNTDNPADRPDYLIGEKLSSDGQPLRYMDKPSQDGRGSQDCWTSNTKNLNPHYSSGVGNHFFYLLAVGSGTSAWGNSPTCNSSTISGIGNSASGAIWYRALTTYMTADTTYSEARSATIKAATDLYGASSAQCATVEKAWSAVSVAPTSTTCSTTPSNGSNLLSNPGFESGNTGWDASSNVITDDSDRSARSGRFYAWLNGYGSTHTDTLSQTVSVPSTAQAPKLSFYLSISTEESGSTAYDTLKVRATAGSRTSTLAGYSNTSPSGYTLRTLDLSAFKGKTVTIKFTGTEDGSAATHFLIDDTAVTAG